MAQTWQPLMGLDDYEVRFEWWDHAWDEARPLSVMLTTASWCYKWATVRVNLVLANGRTRHELEGDLLHEIGHILCAVLPQPSDSDRAPIEEERLVTDLAQAIQRIAAAFYDKGRYEGKAEAIRAEPRDYQPHEIGKQVVAGQLS